MTLATMEQYGVYAIMVLGILTVAVNALAAMTPSTKDDGWARKLSWLNDKLQMFVLPFLRAQLKAGAQAKPEATPPAEEPPKD